MIARLKGIIDRSAPGEAVIDVEGVGYAVSLPMDVWDTLPNGSKCTLWIATYVREDRFDLFGFMDKPSRTLFTVLLSQSGIGPKTALEMCAVPRELLLQAINQQDAGILTTVKGIGKKTAEKLLVELKSVVEKHPEIFDRVDGKTANTNAYDQDAVSALNSLGYDTPSILQILKDLPEDLTTTEERVTAALRSL